LKNERIINLKFYAFITGLHLALLQFSYLLLLEINISSTYVTYMIIVISWMAGAIIGLWWKRLNADTGLLLGLTSYYGLYALVSYDPLSRSTLVLAAMGVILTGLWAGRFFVVMLPLMKRIDSLFLHENNGFLTGVIAVFIGFTLLGRKFLLWAPLITAITLVIYMRWITEARAVRMHR